MFSQEELELIELELSTNPPDAGSKAALQTELASHPDDLQVRLALYSLLVKEYLQGVVPVIELIPHLVRLIHHVPSSFYCASAGLVTATDPARHELSEAWNVTLVSHSDQPNAIASAADFFEESDFARAGELLRHGLTLSPLMFEWRLGCHELLGSDLKLRGCAPLLALRHFEASPHGLFPGQLSHPGLASIAAFECSQVERSLELADAAMILPELGYCDDRHQAHTVRGLSAAEREVGIRELLSSVVPTLTSRGPSLRLARRLAEAGEIEAVRQFFCAIAPSWDKGTSNCELWQKALDERSFSSLVNPGR